jgi:lysophospholipase L1-like esterase
MNSRTFLSLLPLICTAATVGVIVAAPNAAAQPVLARSTPAGTTGSGSGLDDPDAVLPGGWRTSTDRSVTTVGDPDGLHVLVADAAQGYRWQTAATLSEPGFDTTEWIGQACVTGSGARAVVVYAPREATNRDAGRDLGGFVAVVDLGTGAVRKLAVRSSLAYFNPGCGVGEQVAVSAQAERAGAVDTGVSLVDAGTGAVSATVWAAGQLTSAVPYRGGLAAVAGDRLVSLDPGGAVKTLETVDMVPFRLHPDRGDGLAYEVVSGDRVHVRRWSKGHSTMVGTGVPDRVRLVGSAGRVFVVGPDAAAVDIGAGDWTRVVAPVTAQPSSTGALAVTRADNHVGQFPGVDRVTGPVAIEATLTASNRAVSFSVSPNALRAAEGAAASPALSATTGGGQPGLRLDPQTVPWDPDAGCAVPRNDPTIQVFQATAQQVEWAADLAVTGSLLVTRPANWMGSGLRDPWQPQTTFRRHDLVGGGTVPAQVLLGVLAQESNTMQASPHAIDGLTGNFNQGGFYGWGSQASWNDVDCGYGVGQVTSGMAKSDGTSLYTPVQQQAIATDYASNIAASLNALIDKWNALRTANVIANDGGSQYIENWYLAAWAYNTGVQPNKANGNTSGCTPGPACDDGAGNWGLGWANNPSNPTYPMDRGRFDGNNDYHTKHPNEWPYQEKVIGWAYTPVGRFDYVRNNWFPAYTKGYWNSNAPSLPGVSTFCVVAVNHCQPEGAPDAHGQPKAGKCLLSNLHCWWHQPVNWVRCAPDQNGTAGYCGTEQLSYHAGAAEPGYQNNHPPDCSTAGALAGAAIVDDVTVRSVPPCDKTWTDRGTFSLYFPRTTPAGCTANCIVYRGKIDFHQIGAGFGGHMWFAHTKGNSSVTGTWTPPSSTVGWTRIKVHVPDAANTTQQADYVINLGNGQTRHRMVNQAWSHNMWVDLGTFNLAAGASVSLSNASPNVAPDKADGRDVWFDAVAFVPSSKPTTRYVALGDSYSSGEGLEPYYPDSDQPDLNGCHRSIGRAYAQSVRIPGHSQPIATEATNDQADFHFLACSGAQTVDLTQSAVDPGNQDNTLWRESNHYLSGEVDQVDDSGWLDEDTTLVTLTIGGNDVGFAPVLRGCVVSMSACDNGTFKVTRPGGVDPRPLTEYQPYLVQQVRSHLAAVYKQIHLHAPNARVVVVGYPRLFHTGLSVACYGLLTRTQNWLNSQTDAMITTIQNAITDTQTAYPTMAIQFVDVRNAFTDHEVCTLPGGGQWINGYTITNTDASFHPNEEGQHQYAGLINAALL